MERPEGRGVEPSERRGEEADGGGGEDDPDDSDVLGSEGAGLEHEGDDSVAEEGEGDGRRHDEEGDPAERAVEPLAKRLGARARGELGELGARDRHAEERDREDVERLRVAEHRDRAARQEARDDLVDPARDLRHAPAPHARKQVPEDRPHVRRPGVERRTERADEARHLRELDEELEEAPGDGAPGGLDRDLGSGLRPREDERGDDRAVPEDGRRVRQEEAAVAVEDAEAEGREDEEAGSGEEDPDEPYRQLAPLAREAGREEVDEEGRREDAERGEEDGEEREERPGGPRRPPRLLHPPLAEEAGVDRDERSRERAFAEEVLEDVRGAQRRPEGVGRHRAAEVVGEDALPNEPREAAQEYAGPDEEGVRRRGAPRRAHRSFSVERAARARIPDTIQSLTTTFVSASPL